MTSLESAVNTKVSGGNLKPPGPIHTDNRHFGERVDAFFQ